MLHEFLLLQPLLTLDVCCSGEVSGAMRWREAQVLRSFKQTENFIVSQCSLLALISDLSPPKYPTWKQHLCAIISATCRWHLATSSLCSCSSCRSSSSRTEESSSWPAGWSTCGFKIVTANKPRSQAKMTNVVGNKSSTIDISRRQLQPQSAHGCNAMQRQEECGSLHLPFSPVPCTSTDAPQTSPNML